MNPALTPNETFIPRGTPVDLIDFGPGDTIGEMKSAVAVAAAIEQGRLQERGSAKEKLYSLQALVGQLPQVECPLQHLFAPAENGKFIYSRTIFIPAGTFIVGKIHRHRHHNILSMGKVQVFTEFDGAQHLVGPLSMVSEARTKRGVYAETDTVWTTIHLVSTTDLDKIERELIAETFEECEVQS
jgi:hypothetical protein